MNADSQLLFLSDKWESFITAHSTDLTSLVFTLDRTRAHTFTLINAPDRINMRPKEDATSARGFTLGKSSLVLLHSKAVLVG